MSENKSFLSPSRVPTRQGNQLATIAEKIDRDAVEPKSIGKKRTFDEGERTVDKTNKRQKIADAKELMRQRQHDRQQQDTIGNRHPSFYFFEYYRQKREIELRSKTRFCIEEEEWRRFGATYEDWKDNPSLQRNCMRYIANIS